MTKKGRNKKERNKKRIVISCFWYTYVNKCFCIHKTKKKRWYDLELFLFTILLIASSLRSFFLRAICEAYTYTFSSNRTMRGKARKTLCKAFFLRERPIPRSDFFLPSPSFFSSLFYSMHFASRENSKEDRSRKRAM